jgi:Zn-dependent protease with chaperone function
MDKQAFEALITRLEHSATTDPRGYLHKVLLVAALGFVVLGVALFFALLPIAALAGIGFLVIATKGKALILLLKFGKLLILLLIPGWIMLKSSMQLMFSRFPKPQGHRITRADAPALFRRIDELKQRARGPAIHVVLLTPELNAAIVQHPRFGLFGWEENYLILGLPLLQVLSEQEALAVVAHEYGHLSGHHSRLGGFIYRLRSTWSRLQQMSEQWEDWGSRLIAKLFAQYAPYFNAYTFVYARHNEYIADSISVELVGVEATANALMRVQLAAQLENEVFWPSIDKLTVTQATPIANRSEHWCEAITTKLDEPTRIRFLDLAKGYRTDHLDTHPSLSDRLRAIGVVPDSSHAINLGPLAQSAAQLWLADTYHIIIGEFDQRWQQNVSAQWQQRHKYFSEQQEKFLELQKKETLNKDERWQFIMLDEELHSHVDITERVHAFIKEFPEHCHARFKQGTLLLRKNDERGIDDLEFVMAQDVDATLAVCAEAFRFYSEKQPEKAEQYKQRGIARNEYLQRVQQEFSSLPPDVILANPDLDNDQLEKIRALVAENSQHIAKIYLLRRILKADENLHDYIVAFEVSSWTMGDKSDEVLKRLSRIEFPFSTFIVNLKSPTYKHFKKSIARLNTKVLYDAAK